MPVGQTNRRIFIAALGGAAVWPVVARGQQPKPKRLGWLVNGSASDPEQNARVNAFTTELEKLGWKLGNNLSIEYRWAAGDANLGRTYAAELVKLAPDVILTASVQNVSALRDETHTIPIVFTGASDPVAAGLVESYARPGANITGFTESAEAQYAANAKWLELLKEISPGLARVAIIYSSADRSWIGRMQAADRAASLLKMQLSRVDAHDEAGIEQGIGEFAREPRSGMVVFPSPFTFAHYSPIIKSAERHRLPAVYPFRLFVTNGGLMSYGIDTTDGYRRAAVYVDRILRGENPANLPVQAATKLQLTINLKTAKALGLDMPPTLLARADEVIE
jgi:putative ABC transport system substrate-binding protein